MHLIKDQDIHLRLTLSLYRDAFILLVSKLMYKLFMFIPPQICLY
jgi:hypothetical protein